MMKHLLKYLLPVLCFLLYLPFSPTIDLAVSTYFFNAKTHSFTHSFVIDFAYRYLVLLGVIVSVLSLFIFLGSCLTASLSRYKKPALALALSMLIGSGIFTHLILKEHWGRPRPRNTIEFGGDQEFRAAYSPNFFTPNKNYSFPSGHASTGFYFFIIYLVAKRHKKLFLARTGLFCALFLGSLLSYSRIAVGGHFLTDTICAGLIMWLTALTVDHLIYNKK